MISEAKMGHYKLVDDKKCISINFECPFLLNCIAKKYDSPDNTKEIFYVKETEKYNLYLYVIKKCASIDGLIIYPLFIMINEASNNVSKIDFPYINDCENINYKIKAYLRCSVKY